MRPVRSMADPPLSSSGPYSSAAPLPPPPRIFPAPFVFSSPPPPPAFHSRSDAVRRVAPLMSGKSLGRSPWLHIDHEGDDAEDSADEQILRDLISLPRSRPSRAEPWSGGATATPTEEESVVAVLARRVLEANRVAIAARSAPKPSPAQTTTLSDRERDSDRERHRDRERERDRSPRSSRKRSEEEDEERRRRRRRSKEDENRSTRSRHHRDRSRTSRSHRRSASSSSSRSTSHSRSSSSSAKRQRREASSSSSSKRSRDQPTLVDSSNTATNLPASLGGQPHTPPTSSLAKEVGAEQKLPAGERRSFFFPNVSLGPGSAEVSQPPPATTIPPPPPSSDETTKPFTAAATAHPVAPDSFGAPTAPPLFAAPSTGAFPMGQPAPTPAGLPTGSFFASGPAPGVASVHALHARASQELRMLEVLQEGRARVASAAHAHSLALVREATERLATETESNARRARAAAEAEARARSEFIARTHAVEAEREAEKRAALAEAARLQHALHATQLQATHQAALLAADAERARTRAAEEGVKATHALELERLKHAMARAAEKKAAKLVEAARASLDAQASTREAQHAQALAVALAQAQSQATSVEQVRSMARDLQDVQVKHLEASRAASHEHVTQLAEREERLAASLVRAQGEALEALARQQAEAVAALAASQKAVAEAATAAGRGPLQVHLLGLPAAGLAGAVTGATMAPTTAAAAAAASRGHKMVLPLPLPLPLPSSSAFSTPSVSARRASLSTYSDDFDVTESSARRAGGASAAPTAGAAEDEDYADDFASASQTPRTPARALGGRALLPPTRTLPPADAIEESIEFEEDIAPPPPRARAAQSKPVPTEVEDEEVSISFDEGVNESAAAPAAAAAAVDESISFDEGIGSAGPATAPSTARGAVEESIEFEEDIQGSGPVTARLPHAAAAAEDESISFEDGVEAAASTSRAGGHGAIEESISFDEGVEDAAPFHLAASPIAAAGDSSRHRPEDEEVEIEIEEESDVLHRTAGASVAAASGIEEEFIFEEEEAPKPPVAATRVLKPSQQQQPTRSSKAVPDESQEYSADDFVNETGDYTNASFISEAEQSATHVLQPATAAAASNIQPYHDDAQYQYEDGQQYEYDDQAQYDEQQASAAAAAAGAVTGDDATAPLLAAIDGLLAQQSSLLDTRYSELAASTKAQLGVLHRESATRGWSEKEVARRKLKIKTSFQEAKSRIEEQRAALQTAAQAQRLAVCEQAQAVTRARTEAARWEAKLEKVELGPGSNGSSLQSSFDEPPVASFKSKSKSATAAVTKHTRARSSPTKKASSSSSRRPATAAAPASLSSSFDSYHASFESAGSTSSDTSNAMGDRSRLASLESELRSVRAERARHESDPSSRSLVRQERRLKETELVALKLLREREAVHAHVHREARIQKKRDEVERLLREVARLEREDVDEEDQESTPLTPPPRRAQRSPRRTRPASPATRARRDSDSGSRRATHAAAAVGQDVAAGAIARSEPEVSFSESDAAPAPSTRKPSTSKPRAASGPISTAVTARAPVAATAASDEEEVAISFEEDSMAASMDASLKSAASFKAGTTAVIKAQQGSSSDEVDLEADFEDEAALAATATPRSALRTVAATSAGLHSSMDEVIEEDAAAVTEVETEVEEELGGGSATSAHEIETDDGGASYSHSFVDEEEVEQGVVVPPEIEEEDDGGYGQSTSHHGGSIESVLEEVAESSRLVPDQSGDYEEDFVAPSPGHSHSNSATTSFDQDGPTAGTVTAAQRRLDLSHQSVAEEVKVEFEEDEEAAAAAAPLDASQSQDYQADSFATSAVSLGSKPLPAAAAAAAAASADASIAEDVLEHEASTHSEEHDAEDDVAATSVASVDKSEVATKPSTEAELETPVSPSSDYADSFVDDDEADGAEESAVVPEVASSAASSVAEELEEMIEEEEEESKDEPETNDDDAAPLQTSTTAAAESAAASDDTSVHEPLQTSSASIAAPEEDAEAAAQSQAYSEFDGEAGEVEVEAETSIASKPAESDYDASSFAAATEDSLEALSKPPSVVPSVDGSFEVAASEEAHEPETDEPELDAHEQDHSVVSPSDSIAESIEEEASASMTGEEHNASYEVDVSHSDSVHLLETQHEEEEDEVDHDSPHESALDEHGAEVDESSAAAAAELKPAVMSRAELADAVTQDLLRDLARELTEETRRIPVRQAARRRSEAKSDDAVEVPAAAAAPAMTPKDASLFAKTSSTVDHLAVASGIEADLFDEAVLEAARVAELKRARVSGGGSVAVDEPDSPPPPQLQRAAALTLSETSPPSATPTPATATIASDALVSVPGVDSPLGLMASVSVAEPPTNNKSDWSLEALSEKREPAATQQLPVAPTLAAVQPAKEPALDADALNAAVAKQMDEVSRVTSQKAARDAILQMTHATKPYVTDLLTRVFETQSRSTTTPATRPPTSYPYESPELESRLLPALTEADLVAVESSPAVDGAATSPASELSADRLAFHRLLLATANQYILAYNDAVFADAADSNLPQAHVLDAAHGVVWDEVDETAREKALVFSQVRARRAPNGLILSLRPSLMVGAPGATDETNKAHWRETIVRKVAHKAAAMRDSTAAMRVALANAAALANIPPDATTTISAAGTTSASGDATVDDSTPRVHMQLVLEHEVTLVDAILARQSRTVAPGPAGGALPREWTQARIEASGRGPTPHDKHAAVATGTDISLSSALADDDSLSSADTSLGALLYSGSEADWEGGYEAEESARVIAEVADALLAQLLGEVVQSNAAIADRRYTRRLVARARARDALKPQHIITRSGDFSAAGFPSGGGSGGHSGGGGGSGGHSASFLAVESPEYSSHSPSPSPLHLDPASAHAHAERKKARRQAIKL